MAILTLSQPNSNQPYAQYSSSYAKIEETSTGWYVMDSNSGVVYGSYSGAGITYDSYGSAVLGTISAVKSIDEMGAIKWAVSQTGIAANNTYSMQSVLESGAPFSYYMVNTVLANNDNIIGSAGNDVIFYSAGSDTINGGAGNDWMNFSAIYNAVTINLALENYRVTISSTIVTSSISNVENVVGSQYADTLIGNNANNIFIGDDGNDSIDGGAGMDTVSYATMYGVTANLELGTALEQYYSNYPNYTYTDVLTNIENIIGSAYNDTLTGNAANNVLTGGAGNDVLDGRLGSDTADYSTAYKAVSVNLVTGVAIGHGTDTLNNIENVNGSTYNDILLGNTAANILNGNGGDDTLTGGVGNDTLIGGAGIDQANYNTATSAVTVNLTLLAAQNTNGAGIDTLNGIENVLGSNFDDDFTGNSAANTLIGGTGNDTLNGGTGNDVLIGGLGKDTLTGGLGVDVFVFNAIPESAVGANKDVIIGFVHGVDKINLTTIDADVFTAGNQAFTLIASTAAFNHAGQVKFSAGVLSGDATGDGVADFQIALTGVTSLTTADIIL